MRHYTPDSTEATARVVSLAMLADGALDRQELASFEKHATAGNLNIDAVTIDRVMHEFCNDLLQSARSPNFGQIELDREVVDHLLDDLHSPEVRKRTLRAMLDIVNADGELGGGEVVLVWQALSRWGLELHEVLERLDEKWLSEAS